jgi:multiple sugar transport system substrate-binding protein
VQKTVAEFTAGGGPDALYVYDDSMAGWVESDYLQPLDGLPGVDAVYSAIYPSNAEAMTYQGKRYGLPYYTDSECMFYNASLLAKAGITTAPKSLDELEKQALKIKNAGILQYPIGVSAQLMDTWWQWLWGLVYASGGDFFDKNDEPTMDGKDPTAKNVFAWLQRSARVTKILDPAILQLSPMAVDDAVKTERYAYTFGSRYGIQEYNDPKQSKAAGKFKIAYLPSLDGKPAGTVSSTRMYCLAKNTEVKDKAIKLLSYLGGLDASGKPYTAKFWFQQRGLGFAFKSLEKDPEVHQQLVKLADPVIYSGLAAIARPRLVIRQPWYGEYESEQQKALQQTVNGQLTPDAAMQSLGQAVRTLKKKYA